MNWRRWRLGILVALVLSGLVAGSALTAGCSWQVLVSVFCTAAITHLGAFLNEHPVEQIDFGGVGQAVAVRQGKIADNQGPIAKSE